MTDKLFKHLRIIQFISFQLSDTETRYSIGEREILGLVKSLLESKHCL